MDPEEPTDLTGELAELSVLAESGALSERDIDRVMRKTDQETWDDIERAISPKRKAFAADNNRSGWWSRTRTEGRIGAIAVHPLLASRPCDQVGRRQSET